MPIKISCATCGAALKAPDELQGKSVPCPKCRQAVAVPQMGDLPDLDPIDSGSADPFGDLANLAGQPAAGYGGQQMGGQQMGGQSQQPWGGQGGQAFGGQGFGGQGFGGQAHATPRRGGKNKALLFGGLGLGALVLIAAVVILIVVLTADGGMHDPLTYLPTDSAVVVVVKPAAFLQSGVYSQLRSNPMISSALAQADKELPQGQTVEKLLGNIESLTLGFPAPDLGPGPDSLPSSVVVVRFKNDTTIEELVSPEERKTWKSQSIGGETVYSMEPATAPGTPPAAMSLVDARTMLIGEMSGISSSLRKSREQSFSPTMTGLLAKADTSQQLVILVDVNDQMKSQAAKSGDADLTSTAQSVQSVVFQINATSGINVSAIAQLANADSAQQLANQANAGLELAKGGMIPIPGMDSPGVKQSLESIQVTANGTELTGKISISQEALSELGGLLPMLVPGAGF